VQRFCQPIFISKILLVIAIMLATHLSRVVLMVRPGDGLAKAIEFYTTGLGLRAVRVTDEWADLRCTANNPHHQQQQQQQLSISLQVVTSESQVTTGYSPILQFHVQNMDDCIAKCVQLGGHLDGPIQYPAHGKMAAIRSPDGHMIGIYEPAVSTSTS
jgi:catechol 2,3-dioxygenase-like lactoylglutathione lyase family enzyme